MVALAAGVAWAQQSGTLSPSGEWKPRAAAAAGSDEGLMTRARALIAEGKGSEAESILTQWIDAEDRAKNPWYPEALLLRGNARLANDEEFNALYDYEKVAKDFPSSEVFVAALEQEYAVADMYLNGKKRRVLGIRFESGVPIAEEILLRIHERLPGSRLAEKSVLRLADYYYDARDLPSAVTTYDCFLQMYPKSVHRSKAMQRRVFASIAQFKGPSHDASGLIEAKYQVEDFQREFPLDAQRLGMSDALVARLDESGAEQLLVTARWYLGKNDLPSAKLTLSRLIRTYPGTGAAREALALFEKHGWTLPGATPAGAAPTPPAERGP